MNADRDLLNLLEAPDSEAVSLCHDVECILLQCQRDRQGAAVGLHPQATDAALRSLAQLVARRLRPLIAGRYMPYVEDRPARDAAVWKAFTGRNHLEVMREFGISKRLLYSILSRKRRG